MRFEKLVWTVLAMFLVVGAGWDEQSLVGGVTESRDYQAADGGTEVPPPPPNP
jgi:hypothetical protein